MPEPKEMSKNNVTAIIIALVVGFGLLFGWYFFPTGDEAGREQAGLSLGPALPDCKSRLELVQASRHRGFLASARIEVGDYRLEVERDPMIRTKTAFNYLLAIFMVGAGTLHFVNPQFYLTIMPPYLPLQLELVYLSGFFEIALGVLLLVPRFSRLAAWGIFALLIAVFPANIYLYQHQELLPAPPLVHLLRLPLQTVFLLWAYWHSRPSPGLDL